MHESSRMEAQVWFLLTRCAWAVLALSLLVQK
jgi:hypothetical protein